MPPKFPFGIPALLVGTPPGQRGVLIRSHTLVSTGLVFEIRRGRILKFACQSIVIATDANMSENQEAPPRAKKHFRKVGGVPLTAAITAVTGGLQQHTFAQILSSGKLPSCLRLICVRTPHWAPAPVTVQVADQWLRSSYQHAIHAAWRGGCISIAIPIMGPNRLGYNFQRAANVGMQGVVAFFYGNMVHGPGRRTQFRKVVFFIEDDPNYSPHLREQAAINFFQATIVNLV